MVLNVHTRGQAGVSLVEALIAVGLLFIIAAGVLPLFSRAILNNAIGADATQLTIQTRQTLEDAAGSPFDQPSWTIVPGTTVRLRDEVWMTDQLASSPNPLPSNVGRWFGLSDAIPPPTDRAEGARFLRRTRVWQFGVGQWDPNVNLDTATAYDGATVNDFVQLKLVEVDVRSYPKEWANEGAVLQDRWSTLLGSQRPMRVRYIKAF